MRIPQEDSLKPAEINVVPLIDVIFCILVFFILASLELTRSNSLAVNLPDAATANQKLKPDVTVSITKDGQIAVNRQPTQIASLKSSIEKILQDPSNPQKTRIVVISADLDLTHGKVVDVMDAVQDIPNVSLAIAAKRRSQ